ncbi:hypothetical protein FB45DRAFT_931130 [Roridomyces roridus]|uniref:Integrase zinc-binding domain-containing protein n=1 Tax=Roridomyces roridus TaxID=1738132 RepID=A0AAD7FGY9_9AGAR|nr:hypothetical protein FB45DRAFT_931130 [Roridomyces roridus]
MNALSLSHSPQTAPADIPGLPTYSAYQSIENAYLARFSTVSRQDKVLIPQALFHRVREILLADIESCADGRSKPKRKRGQARQPDSEYQLRFWARSQFKLGEPPAGFEELGLSTAGSGTLLTTAGFVVPVREQVYQILCAIHSKTGHGGLEEMIAIVERYYSPMHITKRLVKAFVNACMCHKTGKEARTALRRDAKAARDLEWWHEMQGRQEEASSSSAAAAISAPTSQLRLPSPPTLDTRPVANSRPAPTGNIDDLFNPSAPSTTPLLLPKTNSHSYPHSDSTKENDNLFRTLLAPSSIPAPPFLLPSARSNLPPSDLLQPSLGASWFLGLSAPFSSPSNARPGLDFVGMKNASAGTNAFSSNAALESSAFTLPVYGRPPSSFQMRGSTRRVHPYQVDVGERRNPLAEGNRVTW